MERNKLLISEDFYSVQAEGMYSSGVPAYFIRLSSCNLSCGATPAFVNQFKKDYETEFAGQFKGDLHESGKAGWTCDTIPVWAKGIERSFEYIVERWKEVNVYQDILNGLVHICWSGGEPTILMHQKAIVSFNECLMEVCDIDRPYQEIETNGTFLFEDKLFRIIDQINCSPKLSNSGMSEKQRIKSNVIEQIKTHSKYQFKFVIDNEDNIKEMFDTYIQPFNIPLQKVCCMPGLDRQENFNERTRWVLEMAKKYKFVGLTRLHIAAWGLTTGV